MFNSENLLGSNEAASKQNDFYQAKDSSLKVLVLLLLFSYYDQFQRTVRIKHRELVDGRLPPFSYILGRGDLFCKNKGQLCI